MSMTRALLPIPTKGSVEVVVVGMVEVTVVVTVFEGSGYWTVKVLPLAVMRLRETVVPGE